jgi:hypothetical protein
MENEGKSKRVRQFRFVQFRTNRRTGEKYDLEGILATLKAQKSWEFWSAVIHDKDIYTQAEYNKMVEQLRKDATKAALTDETLMDEYISNNSYITVGQLKPEHLHVVVKLKQNSPWYLDTLARQLGIPENLIHSPHTTAEGRGFLLDCTQYLTHEREKEQLAGKYLYPDSDIITSDSFKDWRERLNKREEDEAIYGDCNNVAERFIADVLERGKTLRECRNKMTSNDYIRNLKKLQTARGEYLNTMEIPCTRMNHYFAGSGGIGKDTACTLYAAYLAELCFGYNPETDDIENFVFRIGGVGSSFEQYDGQPIIIWQDMRAATFISRFGLDEIFRMLDMHPAKGSGRVNVKFASTRLVNSINLINGIQPYKEFLDGLSGEFTDKWQVKHEAEDKNQAYRRMPIIIPLRDNDFDILINKGAFENTREYQQYIRYATITGNFAKLASVCGSDTAKRYAVSKSLVEGIGAAYAETLDKCDNPEYTETEEQDALKDFGKSTGGLIYQREHPECVPEFALLPVPEVVPKPTLQFTLPEPGKRPYVCVLDVGRAAYCPIDSETDKTLTALLKGATV